MNHRNKIIWIFVLTQIAVGCRFGEPTRTNRAKRAEQTTAEQKKKNADVKAKADAEVRAKAEADAKAKADAGVHSNATQELNSFQDLSINQSRCDSDLQSLQFKINDKEFQFILVDQVPNGKTDKQKTQAQALLNWDENKKSIEVIHNDLSDKTQSKEKLSFVNFTLNLKKENNKTEIQLQNKEAQDFIDLTRSVIKKESEAHKKICELLKSSPFALLNNDLEQLVVHRTDIALVQVLSGQIKDQSNKVLGHLTMMLKSKKARLVIQKTAEIQESMDFDLEINAKDKKLKDVGELALNEQNQVVLKITKDSKLNKVLEITQTEDIKELVLHLTTTIAR